MIEPDESILDQVDELFLALTRIDGLLKMGRAHGFNLALSERLAATMQARQGAAASPIINNTALLPSEQIASALRARLFGSPPSRPPTGEADI